MAEQKKSLLTNKDTYLGFDFGNKKIGVAVGQTTTGTANALTTIKSINQKPDWKAISHLIEEWKPAGLIVGLSLNQDGTENLITPRIHKFCRQLEGRFQLTVYLQDETLSTYEAKQLLYDEIHVSARKLWAVQDQLAAQLILQTWLNDQHRTHE